MRDLVRNALRMRPDRIVVGEVRGAEALDMLQAMNTGHEGSLSTCHANGPDDALRRLETMVLMGEVALPLDGGARAGRLGGRPGRARGPPRDGGRRIIEVAEVVAERSAGEPLTSAVVAGERGSPDRMRRPPRVAA